MTVYAFTIGVNHYKDSAIHTLRNCESDARAVMALLKEGFGYQAHYLEERIGEQIESRIEELGQQLQPGDVFIFYFSGHGKAHGQDHYLLLPNARLAAFENGGTAVSGVLSCNALMLIMSGRHWEGVRCLFVIDACRDHLLGNQKSAGVLPVFDGDYLLRDFKSGAKKATTQLLEKLTILNSCDVGRCAVEISSLGHGVFTAAFLNKLREAKEHHGGVVVDTNMVQQLGQHMDVLAHQAGLPKEVRHQPVLKGAALSLFVRGTQQKTAPFAQQQQDHEIEDDETDWAIAQAKNTIEGYETYAKRRPPGQYKVEALRQIAQLTAHSKSMKEQGAFVSVDETQSALLAAKQKVLQQRLEEEQALLKKMAHEREQMIRADEDNWSRAKHTHTITAYQEYLVHALEGSSFVKQAQEQIGILQEAQSKHSASNRWKVGATFRDELKDASEGPSMVIVPPGEFKIGSDEDESEKHGPVVTIAYSFAVGQFPVTVGEYLKAVNEGACKEPEWRETASQYHYQIGSDDHYKQMGEVLNAPNAPIVGVSWDDAQAYVKWLNSAVKESDLGQGRYRLLSEAEWEYVARAGSTGKWSFGEDENKLQDYAWYDKNSDSKIHEVGQKKPNAFGLYEMYGNVSEWVEDGWNADYQGAPKDGSAWIDQSIDNCLWIGGSAFLRRKDGSPATRVLRGGSCFSSPRYLRSAVRIVSSSVSRGGGIGFRVARTAP